MDKDEKAEKEAELIAKLALARRAKLLEALAAAADSQRTLLPSVPTRTDLVGHQLAG